MTVNEIVLTTLQAIDAGLDPDVIRVRYAKRARYCIEATADGSVAHHEGPGGTIVEGPCLAP